MENLPTALGEIFNLRGLFIALPLVIFVLLMARVSSKRQKKRAQKPGMQLYYSVPGHTTAECRGILGKKGEDDIFTYTLEAANSGGWYIHFTLHNPTQQQLDTLYLLQFEGEDPAILGLRFIREAFGMKEPVFPEALLDEFFAQKLGAQRLQAPPGDAADSTVITR